MNCPACGTDNRQGAHFCRMCGKRLSELPAGKEPVTPEVPGAPIEEQAPVAGEIPTPGQGPEPGTEAVEPLSGTAVGQEEKSSQGDIQQPPEPTPEPVREAHSVAALPESPASEEEIDMVAAELKPEVQTADATTKERPSLTGTTEAPSEAPMPDSEAVVLDQPKKVDESTPAGAETQPEESLPEPVMTQGPTEVEGHAGAEETKVQAEIVPPEPESDSVSRPPEEIGALTLVAPGTVIASRYLVVEALEVQENEIIYRAEDLQQCWQCGFEGNVPDDAFCAQCGVSLAQRPEVRLVQVRDAKAKPSSGGSVAARVIDESRPFLLLVQPGPEPPAPPAPERIRFVVGQRSDTGQVRELNEDSMLVLTFTPTYESQQEPVAGLFAVADGMGGHEGGEVASKMALQVLADKVLRSIVLPELAGERIRETALLDHLSGATLAANDAVFLARRKRDNDMGTTLTTVWIQDAELFLTHVGDCRAYRWNADGLRQLTTDHSLVASMIASGQAEPDEIYSHPHRSVIYRSIGDQPVVDVDTGRLSLAAGDRIILCSDGLWEMVRNEGIEEVMMREADPQTACDLLVNHANLAGGQDNISLIVIQLEIP